jgi:hypothetical protein
MTEELNERWKDDPRNSDPDRLLIEGLGMQAHYWTDWLDPNDVRDTIIRFAQTGARVAITELDIPIGRWNAFGTDDEESLEHQAQLYGELFRIFVEFEEHIESVTLWGRADHQSWRAQGFPLIFNARLEPKPAFWAIAEVGEGLEPRPQTPDEPGTGTAEPSPTPDVTPPPGHIDPDDDSSSNDIPPWWAIALMAVGVAAIVIAICWLLKKK